MTFNSVNGINNNRYINNNKFNSIEINLNSKNDFNNLTQQLKPENSNKKLNQNFD